MKPVLGRLACVLLLALGCVTAGFSSPSPAYACDCVLLPNDIAFAAQADAVFVGELVDTVQPPPPFSETSQATFFFEVTSVYRGNVPAEQQVVASTAIDCGLDLAGPGPYLIFARKDARPYEQATAVGQLSAGECDGSRPLAAGAPDPALGPPVTYYPSPPVAAPPPRESSAPAAVAPPSAPARESATLPALLIGTLAALVAALAVLVWWRRRI